MTVLLTGATGFLGKRVLRQLLADGARVRCAVREGRSVADLREFVGAANWDRVEIFMLSLSDREQCAEAVQGCDVVYHVAAALSGCVSALFLNTVVPTRQLMQAAADAFVGRFVLVSSLGVYGTQSLARNSILDESCPIDALPQQRDPYTYSKIVQEEVAREVSQQRQLPLVIVRPGVIYGDERGIMSHRVGLKVGSWLLRMGGSQVVPFTYVENCAAAVVRAGQADLRTGEVINVVDDELPTGCEVIRRYRASAQHQASGRRLRVVPIPQRLINLLAICNERYSRRTANQIPPVLTRHKVNAVWKPLRYSNAKAKQLLAWQPQVDWDTACQRSTGQTHA